MQVEEELLSVKYEPNTKVAICDGIKHCQPNARCFRLFIVVFLFDGWLPIFTSRKKLPFGLLHCAATGNSTRTSRAVAGVSPGAGTGLAITVANLRALCRDFDRYFG
jgi:hypothetical protein